MSRTAWILCSVLCLSLCSCAGKLKERGRFDFLLSQDGGASAAPPPGCVTDLFQKKCTGSTCHSAGSAQVDLVSPQVEQRLVGQSSSPTLLCKGRTYVRTDGSPSLLTDKLGSTPPCGAQMPLGGSLTTAERGCIDSWVQSVSSAAAGSGQDGGP